MWIPEKQREPRAKCTTPDSVSKGRAGILPSGQQVLFVFAVRVLQPRSETSRISLLIGRIAQGLLVERGGTALCESQAAGSNQPGGEFNFWPHTQN